MRFIAIVSATALFASEPALACRDYLYLPPLPNESWNSFQDRQEKHQDELYKIEDYEREKTSFEEASAVIFGQISSTRDYYSENSLNQKYPNEAVVHPIFLIKGKELGGAVTIANSLPYNCWVDGNGYGGSGAKGEYVVLFIGAKTHGMNGVYSIIASQSRYRPIMKAIDEYVVDHDGGPMRVDDKTGISTYRQEDGRWFYEHWDEDTQKTVYRPRKRKDGSGDADKK